MALVNPEVRPEITHQAGKLHWEMTADLYRTAGVEAEVVPFIEQMDSAYSEADFAICRAGALTVAELTCAVLGSILIPFPHAIDDHQTVNGQLLVEQGSPDDPAVGTDGEVTREKITQLCSGRSRCLEMAMRARELAKTGAASGLPMSVDICMEVGCD